MWELSESIKKWLDAFSLTAIGAVWVKIIPEISAFIGMMYLAVRFYETDTVQRLLGKKKD